MKYNLEMQLPTFPIIDMHVHFPIDSDDWLKPYRDRFVATYGQAKWDYNIKIANEQPSWLPSFGFPQPLPNGSDCDEVSQQWYSEVVKYNLKKVVFLTGGGNETISKVVKQHSDVFCGFAHNDIEQPNAAQMLEKAITEQGLVGYKILAPTVSKPLSSKCFEEVFEVCDNYRLPVNIHFGILGGGGGVCGGVNISPSEIAEVVKRFPHANFIIPHFGCGFTNDLLRICWGAPNVYVDTSGNNLWTKWTMEDYTLKQLFAKFLETVGAERIIFGSDSEWFPRGFAVKYLMDQFQAVNMLNVSTQEQALIFGGNAERLLSNVKRVK